MKVGRIMSNSDDESSRDSCDVKNNGKKNTTVMYSNVKIDVEKFNGANNFGMWRCKVIDALCQLDLDEVLDGKPEDMDDKVWRKMNK